MGEIYMKKKNERENVQLEESKMTPPEDVGTEQTQRTEEQEAIEAIRKFTDEEGEDLGEISVKSILGGDFLMSKFMIKQIMFVMFCVLLMIIYTGNRYDSQQDAILIDSLRGRLQEVKYNVLTQSSELMNLTRQSSVEKMLSGTPDSLLHNSITPPFLIRQSEKRSKAETEEPEEVLVDSSELVVDRQAPDEMEQSAEEEKTLEEQKAGEKKVEEPKVEETKVEEKKADEKKTEEKKEEVKPQEKKEDAQ